MHGCNSFRPIGFRVIGFFAFALFVAISAVPAARAACESLRLPAPDNRCAAYFTQSGGSGADAHAGVHVECSYEEGGFFEEIVHIFEDRPVPLRWLDATTLEVGLPAHARFTPPRKSSGLPGHIIRYQYKVMQSADSSEALQCFEPSHLRPQDMRLLSGPDSDAVHAPGWVTYAAGRESCMLVGQSVAVSRPERDLMSYRFMKSARAMLPLGTTELVFMVDPWRLSRTSREPPEIRLAPDGAPIVPQATGPGRAFQLTGPAAEKVLKQISEEVPVSLSFKNGDAERLTVDVSKTNFAAARLAFDRCVSALPASAAD